MHTASILRRHTVPRPGMMAHDFPFPNAELVYRLRSLGMAAAVLHIGAHPDDEDAGLMAYLSRGLGVRTVYWSATRGEGGQNRAGSERAEALGIVRTWESLEARAVDGAEVLYGPFYDFGFNKSGEDTLARWGRDAVLRELVRAIRSVQPHVVVSRWTGGPEDGHGQHQAIGLVVEEAVDAAADASRFRDLSPDLPPWQVLKLYRSAVGDWQPGEEVEFGAAMPELDAAGVLRINTGTVDPVSGRTYQQLAWLGMNRHRSQGMAFVPRRGDHFSYYRLDRSVVPVGQAEAGLLDGLDPGLVALAGLPGAGPGARGLLEEASDGAEAARSAFVPDRPAESAPYLLEAIDSLRKLHGGLVEAGPDDARLALARYVARKIAEFEDAAARCLGVEVDCAVAEARLTPRRGVLVTSALWAAGNPVIQDADVRLAVPDGWTVRRLELEGAEPRSGGTGASPVASAAFAVTVPEDAALSSPYWLREARGPYRYVWPDRSPPGLPFDPPLVSATWTLTIGPHRISMTRPGLHPEPYLGGFREVSPEVVPPVALLPRERSKILPVTGARQRLELHVVARSMQDDVAGTLVAEAPQGWSIHPAAADLAFLRIGTLRALQLDLEVPEDAKPGRHEVNYRVRSGEREDSVVLQPVWRRAPGHVGPVDETTSTGEAFVVTPATVSLHLIEAEFVRRLHCAYVSGADEEILESLEHFDLDITVLPTEELAFVDLRAFDAIVVGPNAYVLNDGVRRNAARLLDYVREGGTLIVQYQAYDFERPGLAPYPFRFRQPHDRVTSPDAPVAILDPGHPVLSLPNRITGEDFDGWVHDRGLYFFGEWDKRYVPLLETADPGEDPKRGGLLVASYGRGTYVYAAYSFFRQIPAGVPGAIRLFANLLGLAEARILERMEDVRRIPLFSFMDDAQLYEVARLMSERWLDAGTYICRQGDPGRELFMMLSGEVEVLKDERGRERLIHVMGKGDVVGELSVLGDLPRSATLRARQDVKLLAMQGTQFREFLRRHVDLSERLTSLLARRLASTESAE